MLGTNPAPVHATMVRHDPRSPTYRHGGIVVPPRLGNRDATPCRGRTSGLRAALRTIVPMLLAVCILAVAGVASATARYADNTLPSDCTSSNYDISSRTCTGTDGNAYNTLAEVIAPTVAGDTIIIRGGVWNDRMDFQAPVSKIGTADAWITVAGYPGETVTIRSTSSSANGYGPIKARGSRGYFIFENLILDGINETDNTKWQIRDGNHHFILRNIEIENFKSSGLFIAASDVQVVHCRIHDQVDLGTTRHYGIYVHDGDNNLIDGNEIYNNPGGGITAYNGSGPSLTNLIIRNNKVYLNNSLSSSQVSGIDVYQSSSAPVTGTQIYNNIIYQNGENQPDPGHSGGIRIANGTSGSKVWNNTIYSIAA